MQIQVENREGFGVLHLRGEFDSNDAVLLKKQVEAMEANGVLFVVLNMEHVKFVSSSALGAMLRISRGLEKGGGKLAVSGASTFCRDVFEKVGLDLEVPVFDTAEDAGQALLAGR